MVCLPFESFGWNPLKKSKGTGMVLFERLSKVANNRQSQNVFLPCFGINRHCNLMSEKNIKKITFYRRGGLAVCGGHQMQTSRRTWNWQLIWTVSCGWQLPSHPSAVVSHTRNHHHKDKERDRERERKREKALAFAECTTFNSSQSRL